jgi:hypothetical protein
VVDASGGIALHVGGVMHLQALQQLIDAPQIQPFEYAVLRDSKGNILARSDVAAAQAELDQLIALLPATANAVAPAYTSPNALSQAEPLALANGDKWTAFGAPAGNGWTLHALRSETRLLQEIQPAMVQLTIAAGLTLLLPTLLGLWMALRYSRRSQRAEQALLASHRVLEDRVQERTAELSRSETRLRVLFESAADAVKASSTATLRPWSFSGFPATPRWWGKSPPNSPRPCKPTASLRTYWRANTLSG